jgi:hypothetical protein
MNDLVRCRLKPPCKGYTMSTIVSRESLQSRYLKPTLSRKEIHKARFDLTINTIIACVELAADEGTRFII